VSPRTVHRAEKIRHLIVRCHEDDFLPEGLLAAFTQERVLCGWLRASGVLEEVTLRSYSSEARGPGDPRIISGPLQALSIEGAIGVVGGAPACSLRAVLARETDRGLETIAGEIASARVVALEAFVTALDDLALGLDLDPASGVSLLGTAGQRAVRRGAAPPRAIHPPEPPAGWAAAVEASADAAAGAERAPAVRSSGGPRPAGPMLPTRPARREPNLDESFPEPGDVVDHFAFGRCDVIRSDGDRLHLKVHKDGRIREIALEMLRVTPLSEDTARPRRFKLERRI
jgi:predicted DNA-binding protein with PD1-like motif